MGWVGMDPCVQRRIWGGKWWFVSHPDSFFHNWIDKELPPSSSQHQNRSLLLSLLLTHCEKWAIQQRTRWRISPTTQWVHPFVWSRKREKNIQMVEKQMAENDRQSHKFGKTKHLFVAHWNAPGRAETSF